jgi:hypothetical protein
MTPEQIRSVLIIAVLTIASGIADSQGFVHSAKIWQGGRLVWPEVGKAALGFAIGITLYWIAIRYLIGLGVVSAEIQTTIWFAVTIIGVALVSGAFFRWPIPERLVAAGTVLAMGWLVFRTGG